MRVSAFLKSMLVIACINTALSQQGWAQITADKLAESQMSYRDVLRGLEQYYREKGRLPSSDASMNDFLTTYLTHDSDSFTHSSGLEQVGAFHKLGRVQICVDPQVASLQKNDTGWQFPTTWKALPNNIVASTDGGSKYVVWFADNLGKVSSTYTVGDFQNPGN